MCSFQKQKERIIFLDGLIEEILRERDELIQILQNKCEHKHFVHCNPTPNGVMGIIPRTRICLECGWREDESFKKLTGKPIREVDRDELKKYQKIGNYLRTVSKVVVV